MKNREYMIEDIIKIDAKFNIKKAFEYYGVEDTENVINRVYNQTPKLREFMLDCYKEILLKEGLK